MTAPSPTVVEVVLAHRFARYPGICRCGGRWSGKHVAQALADAGVLGPEQVQAERERIANAIAAREAEYHESSWDAYDEGRRDAYDAAERIARGES